ncbi:NOGCT domain-containing protein, partial [Candidatus Bathyarchaeota archaeon]|nr:NOGCT domain-containing protein [Candidatus Bathyarchaeota archaeon]
GVFNVDLKADYLLENDEWKHDKVPEVLDGKNVYDYVDPEIDARLADLEKEEERLEQEGYYDEDEEMTDEEDRKALDEAGTIREKIAMIRNESRLKKRLKNAPIMPRSKTKKNLSEMDEALDVLGVDTSKFLPGLQESLPKRGYANNRGTGPEEARLEAMDLDGPALAKARVRAAGKDRAPKTNRKTDGVETETARSRAERLVKLNQKKMNREARAGEADRHETASIAKHLVSILLPPFPLYPFTPLLLYTFLLYPFTLRIGTNNITVLRKAWSWQEPTSLKLCVLSLCDSWSWSCVFGLLRSVDEIHFVEKVWQMRRSRFPVEFYVF